MYTTYDSLGVKFSLYAQRHDWRKIFPLGIKAILAILRMTRSYPLADRVTLDNTLDHSIFIR